MEVCCDYWGQTGGRDPDAGEECLRSGRELRSQEAGQKLAPHLQPASRARLRGGRRREASRFSPSLLHGWVQTHVVSQAGDGLKQKAGWGGAGGLGLEQAEPGRPTGFCFING